MKFIADLHIHSHFSLATSKELDPEHLDYWARIKGIKLVATGDFTHPGWIKELREKLIPTANGLFTLRPELRLKLPFSNANIETAEVYFVLSSEISNIYKKNGKVRKVHNLLYAPDFETVEKMQRELSKIGNIKSDGRPILGLDSRNLLELALNCSSDVFFVPAHIWTPWFSVLGEKGGFNSVEECFDDLSHHIHAVETGLSTDPALNWMCSFLDRFTLLSNSDAHSPDRLGRNANMLDCNLDYHSVFNAIKMGDGKSFLGTIDMFPQEGKYHYDGHRKCNVCWNPVETLRNRAICPVCGKKVVVGVASRIAQLSDRVDITQRPKRCNFQSIIPLPEVLSEIANAGEASKKVKQWYSSIIQKCGSEFDILLNYDLETIKAGAGPVLAEAIRRMRNGQIIIKEGFDGEYGVIKVFNPGEASQYEEGEKLFLSTPPNMADRPVRKLLNFDLTEYRSLIEQNYALETTDEKRDDDENQNWLASFNTEQRQAVMHYQGPALVLAGPGTGKTRVLTSRIACLIGHYGINAENILAVTFTNKAAGEIHERLNKTVGQDISSQVHIHTFHSLGLLILKENLQLTGRSSDFLLAGNEEKLAIIKQITGLKEKECKDIAENITLSKQNIQKPENIEDDEFKSILSKYEETLKEANSFDLDDLVYLPYQLIAGSVELKELYQKRFAWIMIDEYQDINFCQYHFIQQLLPNTAQNLFAIGDPNQAIYGFRGANIEFIQKFEVDYPGTETYSLKKSYRCTDRILNASTQILNLKEENAVQGNAKGLKIRIDAHLSSRAEAEFIAGTIDKLMGGLQFHFMDRGGHGETDSEISSLADFAVLCRTRSQFEMIETVFAERNIPYQVASRESTYHSEPYKTVLDALAFIVTHGNKLTELMLKQKKVTVSGLKSISYATGDSIEELLKQIILFFPEGGEEKYSFVFEQLLALAAKFETDANGFLREVRIGTGADSLAMKTERILLMTMHASKGLEFPCVFIPGCEEGIIPYTLYFNKQDLEEEKRLLYVGMTRASKYLYLSHAVKRKLNNRDLMLPRSRFLDHIEKGLFETSQIKKKPEKPVDTQLKLF